VRIVVFGAGAIGSLLGARLFLAGEEVILVGRPAHVEAIRSEGLWVEGLSERPVPVPATPELAPGTSADALVLAVKAFDLEEAARTLTDALAAPAPILAIQNGLGIEEELSAVLAEAGWPGPRRHIVRAVNSIPVTFVGPGRVRLGGSGEVLLGPGGSEDAFATVLARAGVSVRRVPAIEREVYRKLLVNAAINPVTADHVVENGRLATEPWRGQALALLHEARSVAAAEGFEFSADEAERELFRVVHATAANRSSMLQDLDAGRPTEIDAISGELLELGRRHHLVLPQTERVVRRIRARAAEGRRGTAHGA
jgi:2-dehydropantoate 2-reductase